ncbi:hypothetical protein PN462_19645 [Spirulina sp. CS-785/01]|uniref:hypothetical protein n=1 Tax=Spirulina sp. CS-785/01 TaxID=3021716 RepID=UPI00233153D9|nr:hypothetical protein [Spirulina sp. CS-785/01]MDB9315339.1 hypothetical protein [Spirulina sp. CS-785/01]
MITGLSLIAIKKPILGLCLLSFVGVASPELASSLETIPCTSFDVPPDVEKATCAYITVPEFHSSPQGNTLQLGVILLESLAHEDQTPLVMEQGGPGASTLKRIRYFTSDGIHRPLQARRDIILIEQRGAYYSWPCLYCTEIESYNPITPVQFGEYVAQFLPQSQVYEFAGLGHGVVAQHDCPVRLVNEFLENPQEFPEQDCLRE